LEEKLKDRTVFTDLDEMKENQGKNRSSLLAHGRTIEKRGETILRLLRKAPNKKELKMESIPCEAI